MGTVDTLLARIAPHRRIPGAAWGLAVAAGVYPTLRADHHQPLARAIAIGAALASASPLAVDAVQSRRLLAAGWLSHAVADAVLTPPPHTSLPRWYPPLCMGADIGMGISLLVHSVNTDSRPPSAPRA